MSNTQTKTKAMAVVDVDPRVRMKEVRAMVASAHKKGKRIDLMGFTGDDIARSQIALQDLLTKEQKRHAKAREHIVNQKDIIEMISGMSIAISDAATHRLVEDQERIGKYAQAYENQKKLHTLAHASVVELMDENSQLTGDLEAAMNSLRVALNGSTDG